MMNLRKLYNYSKRISLQLFSPNNRKFVPTFKTILGNRLKGGCPLSQNIVGNDQLKTL